MTPDPDSSGGMSELAAESARGADEDLRHRETRLLERTRLELEALRPQVAPGEKALFEALVLAVAKATARNESVADLHKRIQALGQGAVKLMARLGTLLP